MLTVFNLFEAIAFYGFAAWIPTLLVNEGITVLTSIFETMGFTAVAKHKAKPPPFGARAASSFSRPPSRDRRRLNSQKAALYAASAASVLHHDGGARFDDEGFGEGSSVRCSSRSKTGQIRRGVLDAPQHERIEA